MKTLSAIISDLQRVKGTGRWEEIAKSCGTDYGTIARIAQGRIKSPGIVLCERISNALEALPPPLEFPRQHSAGQGA